MYRVFKHAREIRIQNELLIVLTVHSTQFSFGRLFPAFFFFFIKCHRRFLFTITYFVKTALVFEFSFKSKYDQRHFFFLFRFQIPDRPVRYVARRHCQSSKRDASVGGRRRGIHVHGQQPSGDSVAFRQTECLR